jgi:hypothetical protein
MSESARQPDAPARDRRVRLAAAVALVALVAVACGGPPTPEPEPTGSGGDELAVAVASFDVAVGEDQRLLAGLFSMERALLAFGEVTFQLGYLGDEAGGETELTQQVRASYLGIPGMEPEGDEDTPRFLEGEPGTGVYAGRVDLDRAGFWGLRVVAELQDGRTLEGQATFQVKSEPQVPAVGDPAPRSVNPTAADAEAGAISPAAIDSRAGGTDPTIPDQHLHDAVIADELDAGRPIVVAITTPVYCVSRFCGPLTDVISDLALEHADTATFIHLEVWKDHQAQELNEAAAEWIQPADGSSGNEPWVFLVDGDGIVTARWDNVLDVEELEAALAAL